MTLKFLSEDNGNCRVYFQRSSRPGIRLMYCWQASGDGKFEFLRCSRDGEPSHVVTGFSDTGKTPRDETPGFVPETDIGRELIAFLAGIV